MHHKFFTFNVVFTRWGRALASGVVINDMRMKRWKIVGNFQLNERLLCNRHGMTISPGERHERETFIYSWRGRVRRDANRLDDNLFIRMWSGRNGSSAVTSSKQFCPPLLLSWVAAWEMKRICIIFIAYGWSLWVVNYSFNSSFSTFLKKSKKFASRSVRK